jgi:hypothetical protein
VLACELDDLGDQSENLRSDLDGVSTDHVANTTPNNWLLGPSLQNCQ